MRPRALLLLRSTIDLAGRFTTSSDDQPILQSDCYRWLAAKLNRPVPPTGRSTSKRKTRQEQQARQQCEAAQPRLDAAISHFCRSNGKEHSARPSPAWCLINTRKPMLQPSKASVWKLLFFEPIAHDQADWAGSIRGPRHWFYESMLGAEIQDYVRMESEDVDRHA